MLIKEGMLLFLAALMFPSVLAASIEAETEEPHVSLPPHIPMSNAVSEEPEPIPVFGDVTEEPEPIPVFLGETEEPEPIPVFDGASFEELVSEINWPVNNEGEEALRELRNLMSPKDRIINGQKNVPITSRPFQVHIGGCGGSIIHANWVLTAGHCVTDDSGIITSPVIYVKAGSNDNSQGYQYRQVLRRDIKVHPKWEGTLKSGTVDLALLYIAKPFDFSNTVKIIPMNNEMSDLEGKMTTVSGWGKQESIERPNMLSQTTMKIAKDGLDGLGMQIIRMPNTELTGICQGDSGGPATVTDNRGNTILVGVASYVMRKCGPANGTTVGVNNGKGTYITDSANYVDIYSYMSWITEAMDKGCLDVRMIAGDYESEQSWTFGTCSMSDSKCCLASGTYTLNCKDSYGDGWNGGYIIISGTKYCDDFNGKSKTEQIVVGSGSDAASCTNAQNWCELNSGNAWFHSWCTYDTANDQFGGTTLYEACKKTCGGGRC